MVKSDGQSNSTPALSQWRGAGGQRCGKYIRVKGIFKLVKGKPWLRRKKDSSRRTVIRAPRMEADGLD